MQRILLLIFILFPGFAYSADWILIGSTVAGDTFYVDETSVKKSENFSTVREKQVFKFSQLSKNGSIYSETVLIKTYDCANQTFSILEAIGYDENGSVVFNEKFEQFYKQNPDKRWGALTSSSLFMKSYNVACN